jgi:RHS repeat-associated protein
MRAGNVLLESADARFEYDVRRRRRRKIDRATEAVTEYLWDVKGQLREVVLPTNVRLFFSYDALGRRVRKTIVAPPNAAAPLDGKRTRTIEYVWDGDELAMEIDSVLGERVFVQMPGTFVPVLERRGGETFAYVTDRLGVPREVVDSRGQLAWAGLLSAWGEVTAEAGEDPRAAPPFRLLGQYHDQETGLLYARFRYFDPRTARWLSPDPIGIGGGNNLMAFNGSPTTDVDPLGLFNKSQFEQWLNKYYDMRKKAADAMEARLAALGGKKKLHSMDVRSVSSRSGLMGRTGSSRDPATGKDAHAEVNLTQKERRAGMEDGPRGVAASINHCGNCTQHVFETGGVTASPHRSTGNANGPAFPASAPSTPDDPKRWDGPPVNRWDNEPSGSSTP